MRALSFCTDVEERSTGGAVEGGKQLKYLQLLEELHLPQWLSKRLQPFFYVLSLQLTHQAPDGSPFLGDAMLVLDFLEKEFYSLDVIISLQRYLARRSDTSKDETVTSKKHITTAAAAVAAVAAVVTTGASSVPALAPPKGVLRKGKHPVNQTRLELASILGVIGVKTARSRGKDSDKNKERDKERDKDRDRDKEGEIQADMKALSNTLNAEQNLLFEDNEEQLRASHKNTPSTTQSVFTRDDLARCHMHDSYC